MAGKFEIYKDKAGEYRFRLKAGNGENILASEGYKQKSGCENGIASVKKNAADEGRFEVKTSSNDKPMARNFDIVVGMSYTGPSTHPLWRSVLIVPGMTPWSRARSIVRNEKPREPCPTSKMTPRSIASLTAGNTTPL